MNFIKRAGETTHPFLSLLVILILVGIFSNIIPSGQYERVIVDGKTMVNPDSFHYIEQKAVGIDTFFLSFYYGFKNTAGLMALVFFVGAGFGVVNQIGLMETALKTLSKKMKNVRFEIVAFILMLLFGLQVAFTGMFDLCLVFIPIVVPLCLSLGYDVMTGAAIVMVASCVGAGAAFTNPFFTAIAHNIAELPLYSGMGYRILCFSVLLIMGYLFVMRYARKVKKQPELSVLADTKLEYQALDHKEAPFTPPLIRAGLVFVGSFVFLIYGTVKLEFGFPEMSATFAAMGLLSGLAYGASLNKICDMFAQGMKNMFMAGMVMLFARSILYIMEYASIIDTIIRFFSSFIVGHAPIVSAILIYVMQTIMNFLIPSGSGQAMVTMPMIIPLADMGGILRQVACLASQFGDGFSNFFWPTNGTLIAILMTAGIPYDKWVKFFLPFFIILTIMAGVFVGIAVMIDYGPF